MAIKSESIKGVILSCPSCRRKTAINLTEEPTDARVCKNCQAKMSITEPVIIELTQPKGKSANGLKIDVGIDVSEALKGLKAIQREAKKTARVLREVEEIGRMSPAREFSKTMEDAGDGLATTLAVYECLKCEHRERVRGLKEDYSEVKVCPKCKGAYVDVWKIAKYK